MDTINVNNLNPNDPNLTRDEQLAIYERAKADPVYFLTKILSIPNEAAVRTSLIIGQLQLDASKPRNLSDT